MDTDIDSDRALCLKMIVPDLIKFFSAIVSTSRGLDRDILQLIVYISMDIRHLMDSTDICSKLSHLIVNQLKSKNHFLRVELLTSLSQLLLNSSEEDCLKIGENLIGLCGTIGPDLNCRSQLVNCFESLSTKNQIFVSIHKVIKGNNGFILIIW